MTAIRKFFVRSLICGDWAELATEGMRLLPGLANPAAGAN